MALLDGLTDDETILGTNPELARRNAVRLGAYKPGSMDYEMAVSDTNRPRVPSVPILGTAPKGQTVTPGLDAMKSSIPDSVPILGNTSFDSGGILGKSPQPTPPEGPATSRYRTMLDQGPPKYTGFNKVLDILGRATAPGRAIEEGTGLGTLGYQATLGQAKNAAAGEGGLAKAAEDAKFEVAKTKQQEALADQERAKADALRNPPQKVENLQQEYADAVTDAQRRGVDPATDPKAQQLQDAITGLQKQAVPPKENKAVAGTIAGSPAWGVQTDKGWVDPQTQRPVPNFKPAPNYAQVAPSMRSVNVLRNGTVMAIHPDDLKPGDVLASASAGEHAMGTGATIEDIRNSLQNVREKAKVLDSGFKDRAVLAAALGDPKTTMTSFAQSEVRNQLSPEEEDYVIAVLNAREQIPGIRGLIKGGQATDARVALMLQTIPGAGTGNSVFAQKQIDRALKDLEILQKGIPKMPGQGDAGGGETKTYGGYEYAKQPDGSWKRGNKTQ